MSLARLQSLAAFVGLAMPAIGSDVEVLNRPSFSNAQPNIRAWASPAGRQRTPGKHRPAGAKLWRKAREGKLGARW